MFICQVTRESGNVDGRWHFVSRSVTRRRVIGGRRIRGGRRRWRWRCEQVSVTLTERTTEMFVNHWIAHAYKSSNHHHQFNYYFHWECRLVVNRMSTNSVGPRVAFGHNNKLSPKRCWWLSIVQHTHTAGWRVHTEPSGKRGGPSHEWSRGEKKKKTVSSFYREKRRHTKRPMATFIASSVDSVSI